MARRWEVRCQWLLKLRVSVGEGNWRGRLLLSEGIRHGGIVFLIDALYALRSISFAG